MISGDLKPSGRICEWRKWDRILQEPKIAGSNRFAALYIFSIEGCNRSRMSRGQSQSQPRRTLGRCKTKCYGENIDIIDVDDVGIIDLPESSHHGSRGLTETGKSVRPGGAIIIDDDDGEIDETSRNANGSATRKNSPSSANSSSAEGSDDFCMPFRNSNFRSEYDSDTFLIRGRTRKFPPVPMAEMRMFVEHVSSRNRFGLGLDPETSMSSDSYYISEGESSENDSSDCEIMEDSSGDIREQWERAALKKKTNEPRFPSSETIHDGVHVEKSTNTTNNNFSKEMPSDVSQGKSRIGKEKHTSTIDELKEYPIPATNISTRDADLDPTIGICHENLSFFQNKEWVSENGLDGTQSTDETIFQQMRDVSENLQDPFPGPSCNSRLHHDGVDRVSYAGKCEQVPPDPSLCTGELHCEKTRFHAIEELSPVKLSPPSSQPWVERRSFPEGANILDKSGQNCGESSSGIQSRPGLVVNRDIVGFRGEKEPVFESPLCNGQLDGPQPTDENDEIIGRNLSSYIQPDDVRQLENSLIGEREKHKESDEYKRAVEEEWASRQRQLKIQAEEVKELRKRKKEERRTLEMEKRQKQRLEEIRESQKKDEETINLKENLRVEVQRELAKIELRYRDMASLLRVLGIHVGGGLFPLPREVNAAYKQALLRFHPDRSSRNDIRQQVEAEEKFKLISRLKKTLLPVA